MEETLIINYKDVDVQRGEAVILYNVDFEVHAGEFVYLTGVVGSGKTSLLKTIYGELDIETGSAEVLDKNMRTIKRRHIPALRKQMGIVFQDFRLLSDRNVRKNLDFVLRATGWKSRAERADRISEVLKAVGLADKLEAMPYELSGGEQQRICIARAILNSPKLILADEATGNQDEESGLQTAQILHDLALQGTAVVMATHNNALISRFPGTVYECRDHRLIRVGSVQNTPFPHREEQGEKEVDLIPSSPSDRDLTLKPRTDSQEGGAPSPEDEADDIPVATIAAPINDSQINNS